MTGPEMGRVIAYLLMNRKLDTTLDKRRSRSDERAIALMLRDAGLDDRAEIEGLLKGFGFDLVHFTDFNTQGIAPGAHVFLLSRRLDEVNELFGTGWIDDRMQVRNDTVTERRIWFTQIWFVTMSLFYSSRDRVATEVARYVETTFSKADLAGATRDYINDMVRKLGHETLKDDAVYGCLTSESGTQIEQYCERFLGLMVDGALLDRLGDDRYRQSLLSAAEMRNNHLQGMEPWLQVIQAQSNPLELGRTLLVKLTDQAESPENTDGSDHSN